MTFIMSSGACRAITTDVESALLISQELIPMGAGPQERPRLQGGVGPRRMGFEAVMSSTRGGHVARTRWPALAVGGVGDAVLVVAQHGWSGAPREHAGLIAELGLLLQPSRDLVGVGGDVLVEIDHRLHHHLGVRVGAPAPDLVGSDPHTVVLHPRQLQTRTGAGDGCLGEVHVEHHLPDAVSQAGGPPWTPARRRRSRRPAPRAGRPAAATRSAGRARAPRGGCGPRGSCRGPA